MAYAGGPSAPPSGYTPKVVGPTAAGSAAAIVSTNNTTGAMLMDVSQGTLTVVTVSGGSAATTSFNISGGTVSLAAPFAVGSGTCAGTGSRGLPLGHGLAALHRGHARHVVFGRLVRQRHGSLLCGPAAEFALALRASNVNQIYVSGGTAANVGYFWSN